ncbi:MAG TPA: glycerophosphodiester phosphodiesterase family protein, partial [Paludibacteraceae bacterium]|nr:glycerophosphodiester phosphodiesterase family protein [Paludibacteraceae bacterium]
MKKTTFAFLMILLCCYQSINAAVLIGHRGSYWGVENTEEAFRRGAQFGYNGLETDIKVTSDTKFV